MQTIRKEAKFYDYESQFLSISLAKGYKNLTQHNPCITHKFNADPCAMEYNGTVYVYCTNDGNTAAPNVNANTYGDIVSINCISSKDMVNWTDHGSIKAAGSDGAAKWADNSWAPTACHKKINGVEKFFLYFANNGNGIGVLTSDSPTGPWIDPIGKPLISRATPNCANVTWLFDPAVLVDDDGTGYLYFGGGVPEGRDADPKTGRVVKLSENMTSIVGTPTTLDIPYLFEDSGINKLDNIYYYSYCTNFSKRPNDKVPGTGKIAYMTSRNPMGPFTYQGTCLDNPGTLFGTSGNNHHSMITLNNKSYIFYHAEWLNKEMYGEQRGYRTTHVNEVVINQENISDAKGDLKGISQISNLNPYTLNSMSTMAWQGGIKVTGEGDTQVEMSAGSWLGVSNAEFTGTSSILIKAASENGAVIKVCTDSPDGEALGYINIPATGSSPILKDITADVSNIACIKNLFFVSSADCIAYSWQFSK